MIFLSQKARHSLKRLFDAILTLFLSILLCGCGTMSPLMQAIEKGDLKTAEDLLNQGASMNAGTLCDPAMPEYESYTALGCAAKNGRTAAVKLLLDKGADINQKWGGYRFGHWNPTPLILASMGGHTDTVKLLLDRGADVNATDSMSGIRALTIAAWSGDNPEIVKLLLDRGANVNEKNSEGTTPLIFAAGKGRPGMVKNLVERGADINAKDATGSTALSMAAYEGHNDVVTILVQAGADVDAAMVALETGANSGKSTAAATKSRQGVKSLEKYAQKGDKVTRSVTAGAVLGEQKTILGENKKDSPRQESIPSPTAVVEKDRSKVAVWDLTPGDIKAAYAQDLTSILVSEISRSGKYEVYSQDNVRTLAGWTAERMTLGCTDTKCLTALGQMDIAKLISGRVGKIGNRYSVSLNLFDTQNARAEKSVSEFGRSEEELIDLVQVAARNLLGITVGVSQAGEKASEKARPSLTSPSAGKTFTDPLTGMKFAFIKGGCFKMGDTFGDGEADEKPVHDACVDDYYLGKYEVTVGEFRKFADATGYRTEAEKGDGCFIHTGEKWERDRMVNWRTPGFSITDMHPVVCISWNDADAFARWMRGQGGKPYRLPTEAEWEYAARNGGEKIKYAWGNGDPSGNIADESVNRKFPKWPVWPGYDDGHVNTAPVGTFRMNGLGLYDLAGNVWEWYSDWYDQNYYQYSPKDNAKGPEKGQYRVLRGGGWDCYPFYLRASVRFRNDPTIQGTNAGFRLGFSAR